MKIKGKGVQMAASRLEYAQDGLHSSGSDFADGCEDTNLFLIRMEGLWEVSIVIWFRQIGAL